MEVKKHELMSVIWISVVTDITGRDEGEAEEIIDSVHLHQQEWIAAAAEPVRITLVIWTDGIKARAASVWQ